MPAPESTVGAGSQQLCLETERKRCVFKIIFNRRGHVPFLTKIYCVYIQQPVDKKYVYRKKKNGNFAVYEFW